MICTNCKHERVCKFTDAMAEVDKMAETVNNAEDPMNMTPGCQAFDAVDTIVREAERSW